MFAYLPRSEPPYLAFEVSGKITIDEEQDLIDYLNTLIEEHEKLNFLIVLNPDASWDMEAGVEDFKWVVTHLRNINSIAIVSDSRVLKWFMTLDKPFAALVGIREKYFEMSEIDEAWQWLKEE